MPPPMDSPDNINEKLKKIAGGETDSDYANLLPIRLKETLRHMRKTAGPQNRD